MIFYLKRTEIMAIYRHKRIEKSFYLIITNTGTQKKNVDFIAQNLAIYSSIFHAGVENTYWVQNANFRYP